VDYRIWDKEIEMKHIIDCNKNPHIPPGWFVIKHIKGGVITWDHANMEFFVSEKLKENRMETGYQLFEKVHLLNDKFLANANVLDYLLENTAIIPEIWEGRRVLFLGTTYDDGINKGSPMIRTLFYDYAWFEWRSSYESMCKYFDERYPVLLIRR